MQDKKKMNSLQALRALAFLGVFASHTGIGAFGNAGAWGVSVFFILSGFLMVYSYYGTNRIATVSCKDNLIFTKNKLKRLYLLHILTMIARIPRLFFGKEPISVAEAIVNIIRNILLIQSWTPTAVSINAVSWYLSTTIFMYFIFPWVLKAMEKDYTVQKAWRAMMVLFFVQCIAGVCATSPWFDGYAAGKRWETSDLVYWFLYFFPPIRMLDFLMGCNVGYLFLHRVTEKVSSRLQKKYTCLELLAILLVVSINICMKYAADIQILNVTLLVLLRPFWFSVIFVPSSLMLVWLFAVNKGRISKFLTNDTMVYLGNISQYTFLIHSVVLVYLGNISNYIIKNIVSGGGVSPEEGSMDYTSLIRLTLGFALTLLATQIWMKVQKSGHVG